MKSLRLKLTSWDYQFLGRGAPRTEKNHEEHLGKTEGGWTSRQHKVSWIAPLSEKVSVDDKRSAVLQAKKKKTAR